MVKLANFSIFNKVKWNILVVIHSNYEFRDSPRPKEGESLRSLQKMRFREYLEHFLVDKNMEKINHWEGGKNIDINNSKKLVAN